MALGNRETEELGDRPTAAQVDQLIARLLRKVRITSGLTQFDLAKRLGHRQSYVSKYERGERRLNLAELCRVLWACGRRPHAFAAEMSEILSQAET